MFVTVQPIVTSSPGFRLDGPVTFVNARSGYSVTMFVTSNDDVASFPNWSANLNSTAPFRDIVNGSE